ncbi:cholecystokinin receptor type A-like [Aethina tumida]|uniref:cholecystokinin receptor type A-like n=1 Tax=Aethina tumida TaxID=116153 RepID=UPI002147D85A|nr:cholecystokinin receptor type A-like [Aethina tumida]
MNGTDTDFDVSSTTPAFFNVSVGRNLTGNETVSVSQENVFESKLIIPLYVIIFVLSVGGNSLVLLTLFRNKRMRTVTNVYLVNLAVSDLLLGVFCMPFTLVGQVLRTFIFGSTMCKLIPYFQAVSVSVGVWTLVAISLERYFAICRPLKSRRWQTQFHAYKMIFVVWLASLSWNSPVLVVSSLLAMRRYKCRENWPSKLSEQVFNIVLDILLLLIPLLIMCVAYSLIMSKLWRGLRREMEHSNSCQRQMLDRALSSPTINELLSRNNNATTETNNTIPLRHFRKRLPKITASFIQEKVKKSVERGEKPKDCIVQINTPNGRMSNNEYSLKIGNGTKMVRTGSLDQVNTEAVEEAKVNVKETRPDENSYTFTRNAIRSNNMDKSIIAKKKVIRMLFVMVTIFFICWAPLHFINTWYLFDPEAVYKYIGSTGVSLVQLLAYISSCCNPITYCFMNRKFRQAFLTLFQTSNFCYSCCCMYKKKRQAERCYLRSGILKLPQNNSDASCNESTIYVRRASNPGRSELLALDAEDRV